ncbi:hypothetical protein K1T71_003415 [Dendrolimus kikuchii]|uniref:Uncharacterized protein n=1 Tax=Dendrolimus kikuchii TaxID=765133 RepID=A0ACC1DBW5_9NEOP|nr:hypothetical protein K1T71_003415 [Dendrolimus kikuchii]
MSLLPLRTLCFGKLNKLLKTSIKHSVFGFTKMPYYAVAKGRTAGIFMTWPECEAQVKGFSGARYKKFDSEASAQEFINTISGNLIPPNTKPSYNANRSAATSYNNLKRTYVTSSTSYQNKSNSNSYKSKAKKVRSSEEGEEDSDDSDDLNTIITKQLDDIENRLDKFSKSVSKKSSKFSDRKAIMIDHSEINKPRITSNGFEVDHEGYVQVYTDGACSSNGKNGAKAGLGVYWGDRHILNVSEPVSGRATNNCGEIQAATKAIKVALDNGVQKLAINTDSQFLINSVTKWMQGWKKKGWKLASGEPVKNESDFKDLDSVQNKLQIKWNYVEAHKGVHGNEMADSFAKSGAALYNK